MSCVCSRLLIELEGRDESFVVHTRTTPRATNRYTSRKIVIASGYYDLPNLLGVPGEDLPNVSHYYTEPHCFWNEDVVVVGGTELCSGSCLGPLPQRRSSYAGASLLLSLGRRSNNWVRPDIENRIRAGQIRALFETRVAQIEPDGVSVEGKHGSTERLPARRVFVLTGYHPDFAFLRAAGIEIDPQTGKPALNSQTLESNVPGIFLAGVVIGGNFPSEIFIENGRFHGKQIVAALTGRPAPIATAGWILARNIEEQCANALPICACPWRTLNGFRTLPSP